MRKQSTIIRYLVNSAFNVRTRPENSSCLRKMNESSPHKLLFTQPGRKSILAKASTLQPAHSAFSCFDEGRPEPKGRIVLKTNATNPASAPLPQISFLLRSYARAFAKTDDTIAKGVRQSDLHFCWCSGTRNVCTGPEQAGLED